MNINEKIFEIKTKIKSLTKHFPYTEENINYLAIAYMSFIMLDESIEDLIDEVLTKVYCFFTSLSVDEACNCFIKNGGSKYKDVHGLYEGYSYNNGELIYEPYIIIGSIQSISILEIFDTLIHELKHAINEVIINESSKGFYSGLSLITKDNKTHYDYFDEAFNSFLVKIYLQNIELLKGENIEDEGIKRILSLFKFPKKYYYSYDSFVLPAEQLFKSRVAFWPLYNASLYKNMEELYRVLQIVFNNSMPAKKIIKTLSYYNDKIWDLMDHADYSEIEEEYSLPKR